MDDLTKEISELKQFIVDLKADRAAVKEKEKREGWIKYVSVTVVIIAVLSSIASQWTSKYAARSENNELRASDTWNFYEAKSVKQHLDALGLPLLKGANANDPEGRKVLEQVQRDIPRYDKEKADIKAEAEGFEAASKTAGAKGGRMATAASLFSVSIAMASMCLVTKKKPLWILAIVMAALSVGEMVWAWVL
jgi:hypothetical protein